MDTVYPFVPSEVVLPVAGFAAGQGRMSLVAVIFWYLVERYGGFASNTVVVLAALAVAGFVAVRPLRAPRARHRS